MCDIRVNASDIWNYCVEWQEELETGMHEVACNHDLGIAVFVTVDELDSAYFAMVVVQDEQELLYEIFGNDEEAFETAEYVYEEYIDQSVASILGHSRDYYINEEDRIYERECELDDATQNFLDVAYSQAKFDGYELECQGLKKHLLEIKNHFLAFLAHEYDAGIYRPCHMVDENGEAFIENYPYEIEDVVGYPDEGYEFDDDEEEDY